MANKQRLIVIVGPTASGKTRLAVELALRFNGEVISADSRQVYRGLDIGTEKVTKKEMRGVSHYCIDIASPRRSVSAAQWASHAKRAINTITRRGKVPIIAGGTGFYIDALLYENALPEVPPNATLRNALEKKNTKELFEMLQIRDPKRADNVDPNNKRRLIRALEIIEVLSAVPELPKRKSKYDILWIGLKPDEKTLAEGIPSRLDLTIKKGIVAETRRLHEEGLSWKRLYELGLEYRLAADFLQGSIDTTVMRERMIRELLHYVKRQMRWFNRNKAITWYDPKNDARELLTRVQKFLYSSS